MSIAQSIKPIEIPGSRVRVCHEFGALNYIGQLAKSEGARRILLVTDKGIKDAGHLDRALRSIYNAGLVARIFDEVEENPTTTIVHKGLFIARDYKPDFIIGLGGGSSMDCAKGINFLHTNGGKMQDYKGVNKANLPMLPLIAIPTTSGTGSEAQSFALITDPETHQKMACGDTKASARVAVLDPELTATQPVHVAAATGIDALSHAVETAVTTKKTPTSVQFSCDAFTLINSSFENALANSLDATARDNMLVGAHLAGCAIENSMLGAAHALANPLTGHFGIAHGLAVGLMLPHVVRYNTAYFKSKNIEDQYQKSLGMNGEALADRIDQLLSAAKIKRHLSDYNISKNDLEKLAAEAALQWTGTFNPAPVKHEELLTIYRAAI